ncbi:MAG: 50S ribosomal protein L35 [Saprospiraceae bacterium]|jgi:large subunit ribosomal protein L35
MPKMKTHSSAKKRFKVTGTGKIMHARANTSHLMRKRSTKRKRHLRNPDVVCHAETSRVRRLLCM